jgi:hypothetical protein
MAASATAWPALSISENPGVPAAIVSRSARSISLVVKTSINSLLSPAAAAGRLRYPFICLRPQQRPRRDRRPPTLLPRLSKRASETEKPREIAAQPPFPWAF